MLNEHNQHTWCIHAEHSLSIGTNGGCKVCCMAEGDIPDENGKFLNVADYSLEEIFNSPKLKQLRENLRSGIRDPMCKKCWDEEEAGRASKRVRDLKFITFETEPKEGELKIIEMNLGNTCNIKCRTCGPHSSSQWVREYFDLKYKKDNPDISWEQYLKEQTKYTVLYESDSKFWDSVYSASPTIEFMDFYGGEPFLIKKQWEFIKYCVESGQSKNKTLHYNTNCTVWPETYINFLPQFKQLNMGLSIDGIGAHDNFIRYPTKWETVNENVDNWYRYAIQHNNSNISVCMTLSPMNVYYMDEMMDYVDEKNRKFNDNKLSLYLNLVHDPKHYNISHMPDYLKNAVTQKMQPHLHRNIFLQGILEFMNNGNYNPTSWTKFLDWIKMNDEYRQQNFSLTFPEVYKLIEENNV